MPAMPAVSIKARPALAAARLLLEAEGLPSSDMDAAQLEHFFFVGADAAPVGLIGLEIFVGVALLRSLVVQTAARGNGLGSALVRHAESYAASRQVRDLFLLTTTAENFFLRHGYEPTARSSAPASIVQTQEFSRLCPASSAFMRKRLRRRDTSL
jgi:amino-acid N-acetyltransferase